MKRVKLIEKRLLAVLLGICMISTNIPMVVQADALLQQSSSGKDASVSGADLEGTDTGTRDVTAQQLSLGILGTSDKGAKNPLANATNGDPATFYVPDTTSDPEATVTVDLGDTAVIDYVNVSSWANFTYTIWGSEDNVNFYELAASQEYVTADYAELGKGKSEKVTFATEDQAYARYVRVQTIVASGWPAINFEVWGNMGRVPVESITLSGESSVTLLNTINLNAEVLPDTANTRVFWSSKDPEVATVDESGAVKGVATGSTTITATSADGTQSVSKEIEVTVSNLSKGLATTASQGEGSSNKLIQVNDGVYNTFYVPEDPYSDVTVKLDLGATALVDHIDIAGNSNFTYEIWGSEKLDSDENTDEEYYLLASSEGQLITENVLDVWNAKHTSEKFSTQIDLSVEDSPYARYIKVVSGADGAYHGISFEIMGVFTSYSVDSVAIAGEQYLATDMTMQLTATVFPETASQRVYWSSSDEAVATVDADGIVTGVAAGEVVITATTVDGTKNATHSIIIEDSEDVIVKSLSLDQETATMFVEEEEPLKLTALCLPEDATDKSVSWASGDPLVATVDTEGVVTAVSEGTATITATSISNPAISAICVITVKKDRAEYVDLAFGKSASAVANGSNVATNTLDGNTKTVWTSGSTAEASITVDLGSFSYIDHVKLLSTWSSYKYKIEVSDHPEDAEAWELFFDHTAELGAAKGQEELAKPETGAYARYVKVTITQTDPSGTNWVSLAELNVYGYEVAELQSVEIVDFEVVRGATLMPEVVFKPSNADRRMSWSSDDTSVATVNPTTGMVAGVSTGTTTIHAIAVNGEEYTATVEVLPAKANTLTLDKERITLSTSVNSEGILLTSSEPEDADMNLIWTSSDPSVATVEDGVVTPWVVGDCVITVTDTYSQLTDTCEVNVSANAVYADNMGIAGGDVQLKLGQETSKQLKIEYAPENATEIKLRWESSDEEVATVNRKGKVTAVAAGKAEITASMVGTDGEPMESTITVTVSNPVTGVSLAATSILLNIEDGPQKLPDVIIDPSDATNQNVMWSIEDTGVADIAEGQITPVAIGNTTATVTTEDGGYEATLLVRVVRVSTSVELNQETMVLAVGGSGKLTATVLPNTATSRKVIWKSSNEEVATVTNGVVQAEAAGEVEIIAEAEDGYSSAICKVTVLEEAVAVEEITIDREEITLLPGGDSTKLKLTITPDNATNRNVTWTSSDKRIALVSDGVVTSVGEGTASITAEVDGKQVITQVNVVSEDNMITNDTFYLDTDGNPIYSHGGGIFKFGDRYYWYGAKYEESVSYATNPTSADKDNVTHFVSVTCYSSTDLVHWTFENDIITAEDTFDNVKGFYINQEGTPAYEGPAYIDWLGRLGVMYNESNDNYVLVAQCGAYAEDRVTESTWNTSTKISDSLAFFTCDTPTGNFVHDNFQTNGQDGLADISTGGTGDHTVFIDDDGTPYLIGCNSSGRGNIYVCEFNEDYTRVMKATQIYTSSEGKEGNCMFKYNNRYYICNSDLHGWNSSPTYVLVSDTDDILGSYTMLGIMENSEEGYSHVTQTGFFYTIRGSEQDTVLFCGDRWSHFAGNGMGYNQWVPLSFQEDGTPIFNDLSQFYLNDETGVWSVGPKNNYISNPAFEADRVTVAKPTGWQVTDNVGGSANKNASGSMYSGNFKWQQKYTTDYTAELSQQVDKLPEGTYTLKAWVRSSGGQNICDFYIKGYGGEGITLSLAEPMAEWTQITVCEDLAISGGVCQVGLISDALAGQYVEVDEITLIKTDGTPEPAPVPPTEDQPSEEDKPSEDDKPTEDDKPVEDDTDSTYLENSSNWNQVENDLKDKIAEAAVTKKGTTYDVVTGPEIEVPARILRALRGNNTTLTMHNGDGVSLSVSGKNVTALAALKRLDLKRGNSNIPMDVVDQKIKGAISYKLLSLAYQDSYNMVVNMQMEMGEENVGKYANLYRYNTRTHKLEYQNSFRVTAKGQTMFGLTSGGDYVVTLTQRKPNEQIQSNASHITIVGYTIIKNILEHSLKLFNF